VLRRSGENLSPLEVEDALLAYPAVQDCAVVGVPSELSEEEVNAFVVLRPGHHAEFVDRRGGMPSSSIGEADEASIRLLGHDLAGDLLGRVGFGELAFWLVAQRRPTPGELRLFEAVLVALAGHGFTPSVIAARLTLAGAPESVQGAMAAGLLGGGSRFLGVTEDCGRFLADALADALTDADALAGADVPTSDVPTSDDGWDALARDAVRAQHAAGRLVPGLGHPLHKNGDPRTPIMRIAGEEAVTGPHLLLFQAVGRVHPEILGRTLPLNGAGVCGAALAR